MTTTLCSCCYAEVPAPVIRTALGRFESPYAICPGCWAKVSPPLRRLFKRTLLGYRQVPSFERALKVYETFLLCIGERTYSVPQLWVERLAMFYESAAA